MNHAAAGCSTGPLYEQEELDWCDDGPSCIDWKARLKNENKPDPANAREVDNFIMHLHRAAKLKKRSEEANGH